MTAEHQEPHRISLTGTSADPLGWCRRPSGLSVNAARAEESDGSTGRSEEAALLRIGSHRQFSKSGSLLGYPK